MNRKFVYCPFLSFNHTDDDVDDDDGGDVDNDEKDCDETKVPAIIKRPERCETIRIVSGKKKLLFHLNECEGKLLFLCRINITSTMKI